MEWKAVARWCLVWRRTYRSHPINTWSNTVVIYQHHKIHSLILSECGCNFSSYSWVISKMPWWRTHIVRSIHLRKLCMHCWIALQLQCTLSFRSTTNHYRHHHHHIDVHRAIYSNLSINLYSNAEYGRGVRRENDGIANEWLDELWV